MSVYTERVEVYVGERFVKTGAGQTDQWFLLSLKTEVLVTVKVFSGELNVCGQVVK